MPRRIPNLRDALVARKLIRAHRRRPNMRLHPGHADISARVNRRKHQALSLLLLSGTLLLSASPPAAEHLFVASNTEDSVFRYDIPPDGPPILEVVITDSLDRPAYVTFSPSGELFVVNRGVATGGSGSIAHFLDPLGAATLAGTIEDDDSDPAFDFDLPHGALFRGEELFVVNSHQDRVQRYLFDGAGDPIPNGDITEGLCCTNARGIVLSPINGELFVTEANLGSLQLSRYAFDETGSATLQESFDSPGSNDHGMAFSPWGELFVTEANTHTVARFIFNGDVPVPNGQVSGNGLFSPVDVGFSIWGEMFVSNAADTTVSRFTFDGAGNAVENGRITLPTPPAGLVFAGDPSTVAAPIEPAHHLDAMALRVSPNPGRDGVLSFTIDLPDASPASLVIFDISGRQVGEIATGGFPSGQSQAVWNGRGSGGRLLPPGVYFARLTTGNAARTVKIVRSPR